MVIQFLIIVIFEIHIVHNLDLHASKLIKIAEADINEYPTSTKTEYIDQNTEISVTENLHDPDIRDMRKTFLIAFKKSSNPPTFPPHLLLGVRPCQT
ncbi:hypothetical protein HZS_7620 [Henneguya salminicola]|nr:hypothetical protein HZS_7620 [Henneguya salminicola]